MEMMRRALVGCLWVVVVCRIIFIYQNTVLPYYRSSSPGRFNFGPSYKSWSDYLLEIAPPIVFALVAAAILHYCVNWIFRGLKQSKDQL